MDYLAVEQARDMPGLRLVLTAGVPGPWGEAAKAVLKTKGIDFIPVRQDLSGPNDALVQWTGHRNAPVLVYEGEPPRTGWAEILMLAERLRPEPSLLPSDLETRAEMLGLCHLICGERGFGWDRRLIIIHNIVQEAKQAGQEEPPMVGPLKRYGYTEAEAQQAPQRSASFLRHLSERLHAQEKNGSPYLFGNQITAADLYWACFSALLDPLPPEVNPMPDAMRGLYATQHPAIEAASDPILIRHRDMIYDKHIGLPLKF